MTDADLRQAYNLRKEIKRLQVNIEALRSQAEAITPILTGMPYGGSKADKVGNGAVRIVELQDRLCDKMEALGEKLISINSWIDCIQDSAMRTHVVPANCCIDKARRVIALVEYADGAVAKVEPELIRFINE